LTPGTTWRWRDSRRALPPCHGQCGHGQQPNTAVPPKKNRSSLLKKRLWWACSVFFHVKSHLIVTILLHRFKFPERVWRDKLFSSWIDIFSFFLKYWKNFQWFKMSKLIVTHRTNLMRRDLLRRWRRGVGVDGPWASAVRPGPGFGLEATEIKN
jgi:hypothetical protein